MNDHVDGEELSAWLDEQLPREREARVAAHAAACARCAEEAAALRHLKALLAAAPRRRMPADLALTLENRRAGSSAADGRLWLWASAGALAAAALLTLAPPDFGAGEIPLEPLLTAHARYSAESPLSGVELAASSYSSRLEHLREDLEDLE